MSELWIPGPLPGVNEIVGAARANRFVSAKQKREWTDAVAMHARAARIPPARRVYLVFDWVEKSKRRDPDNVAGGGRKFILDGLVAAGVLKNDGWGEVAGWEDRFSVDKARPGVKVTMRPV